MMRPVEQLPSLPGQRDTHDGGAGVQTPARVSGARNHTSIVAITLVAIIIAIRSSATAM